MKKAILAFLILVGSPTKAAELVIQSFDLTGTLTFSELTNAVVYHVQGSNGQGWTNLVTCPPSGAGTATANVPFSEPFMLIRILAEVEPVVEDRYLVLDLSGGSEAATYPVTCLSEPPPLGWTEEHRTTKLVLRRIPKGTFFMGSPTSENGRYDNEHLHRVTLTEDFYVGLFEVTQEQWFNVMGYWPSYFNNPLYSASRPVERVSYHDVRGDLAGAGWPASDAVDASSFLGRLRLKTGRTDLDLPTEAQWEYACRAGTTTSFNNGEDLVGKTQDPSMDVLGRYDHNGGSNYDQAVDPSGGTARVGSYIANGWGLYDMHGNVFEWCLDWYGSYPGGTSDPQGPPSGSDRVMRGGRYNNHARGCRSAYRDWGLPTYRLSFIGFRLAGKVPPP